MWLDYKVWLFLKRKTNLAVSNFHKVQAGKNVSGVEPSIIFILFGGLC
jgi:hypothetical protein